MNSLQKKSLIVTFLLAVQYVGLLNFPSLLPIILVSILATIIFSWFYLLEVKLEKASLLAGSKFLILPLLFNYGSIFFVRANYQIYISYVLVSLVLVANFYLLVALKRVFNLEERAAIFQRNIIISLAFISIFLSIAALFRFFVTFSIRPETFFPQIFLVVAVALIFYLVSYFLAWENGINLKKFRPYNFVISLLGAEATWIGTIWTVNYPVFSSYEKAGLGGSPLPAIILTIIFYFTWGVISHKADQSLTRRVMFEYIFLCLLFLSVLVVTARWLPQI
jgi:hypothetical protein